MYSRVHILPDDVRLTQKEERPQKHPREAHGRLATQDNQALAPVYKDRWLIAHGKHIIGKLHKDGNTPPPAAIELLEKELISALDKACRGDERKVLHYLILSIQRWQEPLFVLLPGAYNSRAPPVAVILFSKKTVL